MKSPINVRATVCLALGSVFGFFGTFVSQRKLQDTCWRIDGVAPVVAAPLLAAKLYGGINGVVAARFLMRGIGNGGMRPGTAATHVENVPSFAAGAALWPAALLFASVPGEFTSWTRLTGLIGSTLFAVTAVRVFWSGQFLATFSPLSSFVCRFLVLTFGGWVWTLAKKAWKNQLRNDLKMSDWEYTV